MTHRGGKVLLERLRESLSAFFDFYYDYEFAGYVFPLHAKFFRRSSRYFAVKKAELYAFSNFEYLFLYRTDFPLEARGLGDLVAAVKQHMDLIVCPNDEHMSSVLTLIVECGGIEANLAKKIENFKYRKNYKLGFHGWADIKIIAVSRSDGRIAESRLARGDAEKLKINNVYPVRQ